MACVSDSSALFCAAAFAAPATLLEGSEADGRNVKVAEAKPVDGSRVGSAERPVCADCAFASVPLAIGLAISAAGTACGRLAITAGTTPGIGSAAATSGLATLLEWAECGPLADSVSGPVNDFLFSVFVAVELSLRAPDEDNVAAALVTVLPCSDFWMKRRVA
jgi:hypothetical protein